MPRVASLHIHPVKALRALEVTAARLEPIGFAGDRRWMIATLDGKPLTQRDIPAMTRIVALPGPAGGVILRDGDAELGVAVPEDGARFAVTLWGDGLDLACAGDAADAFLSRAIGTPCRLLHQDRPQQRPVDPNYGADHDRVSLADGFPVLIASTASLAALNAAIERPVEMARFRPNIVVSGGDLPPWAETGWRAIRIGAVTLRTPKPCTRCSVITVDPHSGAIDYPRSLLRSLIALQDAGRAVWFGQNAIPDLAGMIAVGDEVTILS